MKNAFLIICCSFFLLGPHIAHAQNQERPWDIEAVDTMKVSRDRAKDEDIKQRIPAYVDAVSLLHPTHIALATPYDEEFYPVLKIWVSEARKHNMSVWFRGNFSGWEGWFNYPKISNVSQHHLLQEKFIKNHPDLFENGDIFTPALEPENGGMGDPRNSEEQKRIFLDFLPKSYDTCVESMKTIGKKVKCGYFSTNGDVAKDILTPEVVKKIGNVVVIDHYVKTPEKLTADIDFLYQKFKVPIILGEFGLPIPDIHGDINENQQADLVYQMLDAVHALGDPVQGINYWTAFEGSTKLFNDNFQKRPVVDVISSWFKPTVVHGIVTDQFGNRLNGITISLIDTDIRQTTDKRGLYSILLPGKNNKILFQGNDEFTSSELIVENTQESVIKNIQLIRLHVGFFDRIRYILQSFLHTLTLS